MENKPLILAIEEAKNEIVQAINNAIQVHNLPCYMVDMILTDMSAQVKTGARNELEMAKEQMKIAEEQKTAEEQKSDEEVA